MICTPHNVTLRRRTDLFVQLGAADPDARRVKTSPELFGKALAADAGAIPEPVWALRSTTPVRIACRWIRSRSPSFTQRYGISASIMDELPYNLVAQPGDKERGVALMQQGPGVYDEYVVDWLYRPVPGARDARGRGGGTRPPHRRAPQRSDVPLYASSCGRGARSPVDALQPGRRSGPGPQPTSSPITPM
ncbi:MAG: zinc-dependent metalloprotease [Alistipes senegalensis]